MLKPQPLGEGQYESIQDEFLISTWNVWFDAFHREERFPQLLQELSNHRPHLMAFQEVTMPFVQALRDAEWLRENYWISALDPQQIGVVLVGRVEPGSIYFHQLPSNMGRRLLVGDFEFASGGLRLAAGHFESVRSNTETRIKQLGSAFRLLKESPRSVLVGDFNCGDDGPEQEAFDSAFADLWPRLRGDDPGYTIDSDRNPMLRGKARARLDRVLCSAGLEPLEIELLGTRAFADGLLPSDHFGLLARFRCRPVANPAPDKPAKTSFWNRLFKRG